MASETLKIAAAQINTQVNNVWGNVDKIIKAYDKAAAEGVDLVITPELSISGYPLQDSVEHPDLLGLYLKGLEEIKDQTAKGGPGIIVGLPQKLDGGRVYNTAVLLHNGQIQGLVRKKHLPNYDVFDEKRNYAQGTETLPLSFKGHRLGVLICEDLWHDDVARDLKAQGAQMLIALNASPFEAGKAEKRINEVAAARVFETGLPVLYVNQVGGQDEIVFDGASFALDSSKKPVYRAPAFEEALNTLAVKFEEKGPAVIGKGLIAAQPKEELEMIWQALVTGTRDYLKKIGYKKAILGMSGGIDSAVVAAIAADALGPENVMLYKLPSQHTSSYSNSDADEAARLLGVKIEEISIQPAFKAMQDSLKPQFDAATAQGRKSNVERSLENMQARIRGAILMSLSNAGEGLLLTTGNKSEVSVGYCTIYGDMNGGFNPLKDIYKTMVYDLARWRNKNRPAGALGPKGKVMPDTIINKPPSAELAPGQLDSNSLPPYEVLDPVLKAYIEGREPMAAIIKKTGQPQALVREVIRLVDAAEFKRQQAAPGVKISSRSFGKGRRYPIAQPAMPVALSTLGFKR